MSTVLESRKKCYRRPSRSLVKNNKVFRQLNFCSMHRRMYLGVVGTLPPPHRPSGLRCSPQMPQGRDFHTGLEAQGRSPVCQSPEEGEQGDVRKRPPTKQPQLPDAWEHAFSLLSPQGQKLQVSPKLLSSYKLGRLCSKHLAMG